MVRERRGRRPLIGITRSDGRGTVMTLLNRLAIHRAGGRSVVISPRRPFPAERPVGLVIGGGDDIGPVVEAGALEPALRIDRARDRLERRLLDDLAGPGFPILGICRGAQMLNLHRGGTLHADIYAAYAGARRLRTVLPRKRVAIRPGTRLAGIIGRERVRVNALHHQSVDRLGRGLAVAAIDEAGIVQAVEDAAARFVIGVQWHPEMLVTRRRQQRLFDRLVEAAPREPRTRDGRAVAQLDPTLAGL